MLVLSAYASAFTIRIRMQSIFLNDSRFSSPRVFPYIFFSIQFVFSRLASSRAPHTHDSHCRFGAEAFLFSSPADPTILSAYRNFHALSNRICLRVPLLFVLFFPDGWSLADINILHNFHSNLWFVQQIWCECVGVLFGALE